MTGDLVVRGAEIEGREERLDVRVTRGVIVEVGPALGRRRGEAELEADGAALLCGLHDHHIHLMATAAARSSVRVGPPEVTDAAGLARVLAEADRRLPAGAWIRATGYHESVAGDLDRHALDRLVPDRPVRVQDRSGARWTLNHAAVAVTRLDEVSGPEVERDAHGQPTGRIHRGDQLLRARLSADPPDLTVLGADLAARGVTTVTDTTPYRTLGELAPLAAAGLPQRVVVTGGPELAGADAPPGLAWGPVKLVIDDARYPIVEEIADGIAQAHRHGRNAAIHCVTRAALALAVAAWDVAGSSPGDRVEHGSVVPPDLRDELVRLGLTVVTQPGFVAARGDQYLDDVDPEDRPFLYPCASLLRAGVPVRLSTDAPYTAPDPWLAIAAATSRRTPSGVVLGPDERVDAATALRLFTGGPVAVGRPGDLCLLDRALADALAALPDVEVAATVRAGRVIWSAPGCRATG